jgi:polysaccharide deacetylase family protein (PEP-CTERM system associated)
MALPKSTQLSVNKQLQNKIQRQQLCNVHGGMSSAWRPAIEQKRGKLKKLDQNAEKQGHRAEERESSHILSVDVEDYFQVEAFAGQVARESWERWPSRVVANTQRVLDLFDQYQAKATFFFVGWVAARFPYLVREVQSRGHELACHSYWHRTVYSLTPQEFREDTRRAKRVIEDASGTAVHGYRAPSWSITKDCLWALDVLAEEGFIYDSSIYPIHHDLYGMPGAKRFAYTHRCGNGLELREFPPATLRFLATNFPVAGGGYLRIFPSRYTEMAFHRFQALGERLVVYLHPWELDPEQPRIRGPLKSRLRHYTSLGRMEARLRSVLQRHTFAPFRDVLEEKPLEATSRGNPQEPQRAGELAASQPLAAGQGKADR